MASFEVIEDQGTRYVRIELDGTAVRAEAGAFCYMRGEIEVDTPLPSPLRALGNILSDEPIIRPRYHGKGELYLTATLGGYHTIELDGEAWILENGAYWASDASVELGLHREPMMTSFWAGEGFIDFQTKVSGKGRVVLNAPGTIDEVVLKGETLTVEGKQIIARTEGLSYKVRRPIRSRLGYWLSEEELCRVYSGYGRVLVITAPFWNQRMMAAMET